MGSLELTDSMLLKDLTWAARLVRGLRSRGMLCDLTGRLLSSSSWAQLRRKIVTTWCGRLNVRNNSHA